MRRLTRRPDMAVGPAVWYGNWPGGLIWRLTQRSDMAAADPAVWYGGGWPSGLIWRLTQRSDMAADPAVWYGGYASKCRGSAPLRVLFAAALVKAGAARLAWVALCPALRLCLQNAGAAPLWALYVHSYVCKIQGQLPLGPGTVMFAKSRGNSPPSLVCNRLQRCLQKSGAAPLSAWYVYSYVCEEETKKRAWSWVCLRPRLQNAGVALLGALASWQLRDKMQGQLPLELWMFTAMFAKCRGSSPWSF